MKKSTDEIDAALRDLDPAPPTGLSEDEVQRADAVLARIVSTPASPVLAGGPGRKRRRRRAAAAALVGAFGAASYGLIAGSSAFASWTPTPQLLTAPASQQAAASCRAALGVPELDNAVVLAERRGEFTYVLLTSARAEGACLLHDDLLPRFDEAKRSSGFLGTADSDPAAPPALPSDGFVQTGRMDGSMSVRGRLPFTTDDAWLNWVTGYVGADVTRVTVHPPTGPEFEASVEGGRFVGWWPSDPPSSDNLDVMKAPTYSVTLADGTVRELAG